MVVFVFGSLSIESTIAKREYSVYCCTHQFVSFFLFVSPMTFGGPAPSNQLIGWRKLETRGRQFHGRTWHKHLDSFCFSLANIFVLMAEPQWNKLTMGQQAKWRPTARWVHTNTTYVNKYGEIVLFCGIIPRGRRMGNVKVSCCGWQASARALWRTAIPFGFRLWETVLEHGVGCDMMRYGCSICLLCYCCVDMRCRHLLRLNRLDENGMELRWKTY